MTVYLSDISACHLYSDTCQIILKLSVNIIFLTSYTVAAISHLQACDIPKPSGRYLGEGLCALADDLLHELLQGKQMLAVPRLNPISG